MALDKLTVSQIQINRLMKTKKIVQLKKITQKNTNVFQANHIKLKLFDQEFQNS